MTRKDVLEGVFTKEGIYIGPMNTPLDKKISTFIPPIDKVGYATMPGADTNDGKSDKGKLRWDLLPFSALDEVVEILTEGVEEYGEESWKKVPNAKKRYFAALMRHLTDWWRGVKKDKKSGHHPLAHVCCNVLFLLWLDKDSEEDQPFYEEE